MSRALLDTQVVARAAVDGGRRGEMLALMERCYEGVTPARFAADLDDKQHVILVTERRTGRLVGFSTVRVAEERLEGRPVDIVYSGDTVLHPDWWGAKAIQVAFARFVLARKLSRPSRPCLWLLLSGGYRTYLIMVNHLPRAFPSRRYEPTTAQRAFLDRVARAWFGAHYDPVRGVVRFGPGHYRVRQDVVPLRADTVAHPDVAYFLARNPGHAAGDELVCLAELRVSDMVRVIAAIARRRLGMAPRRDAVPATAMGMDRS